VCARMWEEERGRQRGEVESERVRVWGVYVMVYVNL
jgi:hypothetical protein